jgi:hypothetical protein
MNRFDNDLREALKRRQAPAGFVDKVMSQVRNRAQERTREVGSPRTRAFAWHWAPALAVALILAATPLLYREHLRRIEGEKAKEQLLFALRVTGSKLRGVQEKVVAIQVGQIETTPKQ